MYNCQNFTDINLMVDVEIEGKLIPFTGYIILHSEVLAYMDINFEHFKSEISRYLSDDENILNLLSKIQLNCINAFDISGKKVLYECAKYINDLGVFQEGIRLINEMQLIKRKRHLTKSEKEKIISAQIDKDHVLFKQFECCINILLDEYDRFELNYCKLNIEEKTFFNSWPITYLIPQEYRDKLMMQVDQLTNLNES